LKIIIISVGTGQGSKVYENCDRNIRSGYHMLENGAPITKPVIWLLRTTAAHLCEPTTPGHSVPFMITGSQHGRKHTHTHTEKEPAQIFIVYLEITNSCNVYYGLPGFTISRGGGLPFLSNTASSHLGALIIPGGYNGELEKREKKKSGA
jgi:hypothetical protein